MREAWAVLLASSLAWAFAACGSSAPSRAVAAKNYDRRCVSVADCAAVYEGAVGCCGVGCPNAAIAQAALAKYTSDVDRIGAACSPVPSCPVGLPNIGCDMGRVACRNGLCALDVPDAGTNGD